MTNLERLIAKHEVRQTLIKTGDVAAASVCNWCLLQGSPFPVTDDRFFEGHEHIVSHCAGCIPEPDVEMAFTMSQKKHYEETAWLKNPWPCETWVLCTQDEETWEYWDRLVQEGTDRLLALRIAQAEAGVPVYGEPVAV